MNLKPRRTIYSVATLLFSVTICGMLFALIRFLSHNTQMLTPIVMTGVAITLLLIPDAVSRFESTRQRSTLGCCLLPILVLLIALAFSMLIFFLSNEALALGGKTRLVARDGDDYLRLADDQ